jgi:amidase
MWTQAEGIDMNSDEFKHMVEQEQFFGGAGGI